MPSKRKVPKSLLPKDIFGEGPDITLIYFNQIGNSIGLSRSEEERLCKLIKEGDEEAFEKLVVANLRFVIRIAKGYQNKGLSLSDLIGAGNLGLLIAAKRFDASKGFKFISYAVWWIRQAILQALAIEARNVHLPVNRLDLITDISKLEIKLTQELGRIPTLEELAEGLGESIEETEEAKRLSKSEKSLDVPMNDDGHMNWIDFVVSKNESEEDRLEAIDRQKILSTAIDRCLDAREKLIVEYYFGFNGREILALEDIGSIIGLTRERVRQLRNRATDKLRAYLVKRKLVNI